jgi:hypothetical protein
MTDWERGEGFRETLLMHFTGRNDAAALRHVGALLYDLALGASHQWPDWPESPTRTELRAALADLRHLRGFLHAVGREHEVSSLAPPDIVLSQLAAEKARELARIVEELERRL